MQFDVLAEEGRIGGIIGRMIHDLGDDHRADERTGVRRAQSIADLRDEIFVGLTVQVTAKAHAFIRGAKVESVNVTRKIAIRIR